MGVPLKALNDYLDLELPACPAWEKGYVASKLTAIGEEAEEAAPAEGMDDTVALMRGTGSAGAIEGLTSSGAAVSRGLRIADVSDASRCVPCVRFVPLPTATDCRNVRGTAESGSKLPHAEEMVKGFVSRFNRELMKARMETLRRLERKRTRNLYLTLRGLRGGWRRD